MKRVICLLLSTIMLLSIFCTAYAKEFSDVPKDHWAYQYVNELSEQGVINGYDDGTYKPTNEVTRAEFLKLIVCCIDAEKLKPANVILKKMDLESKIWYYKYYMSAVILKLCNAVSVEERDEIMNSPISREEMMIILYNFGELYSMFDDVEMSYSYGEDFKSMQQIAYELGYIKDQEMDSDKFIKVLESLDNDKQTEIIDIYQEQEILGKKIEVPTITNTFSDLDYFNFEELVQLEKVYKVNLLNGYEDGTFRPENGLTRAEVAAVISRALNMKNGVN